MALDRYSELVTEWVDGAFSGVVGSILIVVKVAGSSIGSGSARDTVGDMGDLGGSGRRSIMDCMEVE